jgi:hypothetical protein
MENQEKKGIFVKIFEWFKNLTVKGLLGMILVAFIILILISTVSYLPKVISKISSSFSTALYSVFVPAEGATVTVNKKIINSGEDFIINFKKGDLPSGLFTINYNCDPNTELFSIESNGLKKINCEIPYYLLDDETSIKIKARTNDSLVRLVIDTSFENNENQKIEKIGVIRVTIKNDMVGTVIEEPTTINTPAQATTTNVTTAKPISNLLPTYKQPYYGKADLAVRLIQVGILNQYNNTIISTNQFSYTDTVGIRFEVRNDGDLATGPWYFTGSLPSLSTPTYTSPMQVSLQPGESIIFTLGFNSLKNQYVNTVIINIDPQGTIIELNKSNNFLTTTLYNNSYNSNYYYNNYNTGCYINGVFTYNCQNYYYNNPLIVSCYARPNDPERNDRVRWYVNVTGGDGDYEYEWSGTNGLDSTSKNPSKTYTSRGTKYAYVTVESADYRANASCSVYVD